jgi:hypothetical protein
MTHDAMHELCNAIPENFQHKYKGSPCKKIRPSLVPASARFDPEIIQ